MENHAGSLSIGLRDLKDGNHHFTFTIGEVWLQEKGLKPVEEGIIAEAEVSKVLSVINVGLTMQGAVIVPCDRCLADIPLPIEGRLDLQYRISELPSSNDEILVISPEDKELSFDTEFHDLLFISMPMKRSCDEPGNSQQCDMEVLKFMKEQETEKENDSDTWNELKKLLE